MFLNQRITIGATIVLLACGTLAGAAENLCPNGDFSEVRENGMPESWFCDFAWMNRSHWMKNEQYLRIADNVDTKRNVLVMVPGVGGDESVIASAPIPYDPEARYVISFDAKTDGPQARIYIRGYKWKSGVRPHPKPHLGELQNIYRGKPFDELESRWKHVQREFPYFAKDKMSDLSKKHLRTVRFIVLYITITLSDQKEPLYIDNVEIRKK